MKTAAKIAMARAAYRVVHSLRALAGQGDRAIVERNGVKYALDLGQGVDFSIFLRGAFEPSTAAALRRETKSGAAALDIGANIGAHTLSLAKHVGPAGRVLAFEPTGYAFDKLSGNLSLNPELAARVKAFKMFLGATDAASAPQAIYSSWPLIAGDAGLHAGHLGRPESTSGTPSRTLDAVLADEGVARVDIVKLDVDGFECEVLAGAAEMMRRDRPVFVMELAPYVLKERGASLDDLLGFFLPLGYRFETEDGRRPLPNAAAEIEAMIPSGASRNVIARVGPGDGAQ